MARSSRDQWETGVPASAGLVVASTSTLCRSSGGKSDRSAAAREVVEALQAMLLEAPPPAGDRVGVALQFGPHLQVGGFVGLGATQNESGPEGEPLGRRTGLDEGVEVLGFVHRQTKAGGFPGHGGPSRKKCGRGGTTPEKGIATGGTSPDAPMYTKVQVKPMNLQNSRLVGRS